MIAFLIPSSAFYLSPPQRFMEKLVVEPSEDHIENTSEIIKMYNLI